MSDNPRLRRKSKSKDQSDNQGHKTNGTHKQTQQPQIQQSQPQQLQQQSQQQSQPQQNGHKHNTPKQSKPTNNNNNNNNTNNQQLEPQAIELKSSQTIQRAESVEFNSSQIEQHLQTLWDETFEQSKNSTVPFEERPTIYQDSSKAWGSEGKNPFLSNFNFFQELKKSYIAKFGTLSNPSLPKTENTVDEKGNSDTNLSSVHNSDNTSIGKNVNNNVNISENNNKATNNNDNKSDNKNLQNKTRGKKENTDNRNEIKVSGELNGKHELKDTTPKGATPKEIKTKETVKETKNKETKPKETTKETKKDNKATKDGNKLTQEDNREEKEKENDKEKEKEKEKENEREKEKEKENEREKEKEQEEAATLQQNGKLTNKKNNENDTPVNRVQKYDGPQTVEETQHLLQEEEEEENNENDDKKEKNYEYGFTTEEYEEIAEPSGKRTPGDVIIDILGGDEDDDYFALPKTANGKPAASISGKSKNKKTKKGKSSKPGKHVNHDESKQGNKNNNNNNINNNNNYNNNNNNFNNNNYNSNSSQIINLNPGNKEVLNDLLGNILSRPKSDSVKMSGTGTLQVDNSGNFEFSQETVTPSSPPSQSSSLPLSPSLSPPLPSSFLSSSSLSSPLSSSLALFHGVPREVVRVFSNRFSKPNPTNPEFPGVLPVKWSSGEGMMAAGRKFPIEVPFLLKDMLGNTSSSSSSSHRPASKTSCANLRCTNTTTEDKPYKTCAKCNVTAYCCRECQIEDWTKRHKQVCKPNAAERKAFATQKFWSTSSIRQMMFLHWYARYGKGVIVIMGKDFLITDDESRELYIFYLSIAELSSDECPIPSLKKSQSELSKSLSHHDPDTYVITTVAVDSTGYNTTHVDEVKSLQLKLHKRSYKEHDLMKVDAISIDIHNSATLYSFH